MTWTWRLERPDGTECGDIPGVIVPTMPNQSDAESWLGEHWRDLADADVAQVTLYEDDRLVYGPMPLSEE